MGLFFESCSIEETIQNVLSHNGEMPNGGGSIGCVLFDLPRHKSVYWSHNRAVRRAREIFSNISRLQPHSSMSKGPSVG